MRKVSKCVYCADPDLFDKRLTPTDADRHLQVSLPRRGSHWPEPPKVKIIVPNKQVIRWGATDPREVVTLKTPEVIRGKIHVRTITDADMVARFAGFKIQVIGVESPIEPPLPSGVFFGRYSTQEKKSWLYVSYHAARITHQDSPIFVDSHWHPSHGRIVTVRGFGRVSATTEEKAIINTALGFDTKPKRRGAPPKVADEAVLKAIREQGEKATQKSVAASAGVAPRTLQNWLYFRAGMNWDYLKEGVLSGRVGTD